MKLNSKLKLGLVNLIIGIMLTLPVQGFLAFDNSDDPYRSIAKNFAYESSSQIYKKNDGSTRVLNIPIFGYSLVATDRVPIERDENAMIKLVQLQQGLVDIEILTKFEEFVFDNVQVNDGELWCDLIGEQQFRYEIENPLKGFFMELYITASRSWINLAFDGGERQLIYDGVLNKGFLQFDPYFDDMLEFKKVDYETSSINARTIQEMKEYLRQNQQQGLYINNANLFGDSSPKTRGSIPTTQYGISHECYDFYIDYPDELPDDYWELYTCIDVGIHRKLPSESQVKSDLQYYNKYYFHPYGSQYDRDIMAYNMVTHGGPEWGVFKLWFGFFWRVGTIWPSEVEDLWYEGYEGSAYVEVTPEDTVVMVDVCYGYWDSRELPEMAWAFFSEDPDAAAFIGPTIETPKDSDSYMRAFWNDLCQNDKTVYQATITLCNTYGHGWNLWDEWYIMGDWDWKIPN